MADLKYSTPAALFKAICDALRAKLGTAGVIRHQDIPEKIASISTGTDTSDATATADDIRDGLSAYGPHGKMIGTMETVSVPAPEITVSGGGLITAKNTQNAGYTPGGEASGTSQLSVKAGETVRPTTTRKTAVESGKYTTGPVYVEGDENLIPTNIVSGKSIFGIQGAAQTGATPARSGTAAQSGTASQLTLAASQTTKPAFLACHLTSSLTRPYGDDVPTVVDLIYANGVFYLTLFRVSSTASHDAMFVKQVNEGSGASISMSGTDVVLQLSLRQTGGTDIYGTIVSGDYETPVWFASRGQYRYIVAYT